MEEEYDYDEEGGETFIDPKDLDIITNNRNWRPTEAQIEAYANQLEFNLDSDPPEVLQIAEKYLTKPLPDNWARAFTKVNPQLLYIELDTNEIHLSTDLEEKAKEEYIELMEEYQQQLREEEEKAKKVTVVPRKKIAPIGAKNRKEDTKEKREKDFIKNIKQHKSEYEDQETKELREKMNKDKIREEKVGGTKDFLDFTKPKPQKKEPDHQKKSSYNFEEINDNNSEREQSSDDNSQIIHIEDHSALATKPPTSTKKNHFHGQKEVFEDESIINKKQKEKEETAARLKLNDSPKRTTEEDEEDDGEHLRAKNINIDDLNNEQFLTPVQHQQKESLESNDNIMIKAKSEEDNSFTEDKIKYKERAVEEIKKYKQKLKDKYNKDKEDTFKMCNEEYERNFNIEKRKLKDKLQRENSQSLKEIANRLSEETDNLLNKYKDELRNEYEKKMLYDNSKDDLSDEISALELKKQKIISSIKLAKLKKERLNDEKENGIIQKKYVLEQKKKIQKESLDNKYRLKLMELEKEMDSNYQSEIKLLQQEHQKTSSSSTTGTMFNPEASIPYNELLKEYQKQLDETFEIKKKEIEREIESKMSNDIEVFKSNSLSESTDKVNFIHKEISVLEKSYYDELADIRKKGTDNKQKNYNQIKDKLNHLSTLFDKMKNDTSTIISNQIKELVINIQHFIRTETNDTNLTQLEEKVEEYVSNVLSEKTIQLRKMKSLYDLSEKEFLEKELLINYYVDILSFLNKNIIEKPLFENEGSSQRTGEEDSLITSLFKFGKEKISEYRMKNKNMKAFKFFPFLEAELYKSNVFNDIANANASIMNYSNAENSIVNIQLPQHQNSNSFYFNHSSSTPNIRNSQVNTSGFLFHGAKPQQPVVVNNPMTSIRLNPQYTDQSNKVSTRYPPNSNNINMNTFSQSNRSFIPYTDNNPEGMINENYGDSGINQQNNQFDVINTERHLTLKLPNEIISTFPDNVFQLYSNIIDFLSTETIALNKEYSIIAHQVQLSTKLAEINENGDLLQYSQAFNEEKLKSIRREKLHLSKVDTFEIIKSHIDEVFNFIIDNSTRKDIFPGKLEMLIKHIDDYNKTFGIKTLRTLSIENPTNISLEYDNTMKKRMNNMGYDGGLNNINVENVNNSFTNFYSLYGPNRLNDKFNTNYSHEFFNFKKNNEYLNYKVMSNTNYNYGANPSRNFFFGKGYQTYY